MRPRLIVPPFGESMQFIPYRRSRAETSIFTISESLGKMPHSKKAPKTSCVIRWEEDSGAGETVGAITGKRCFNGAHLAQTAFAPGPPPTTPHTPFGPPLFGRRLAQRQASQAATMEVRGGPFERSNRV